MRLPKNCPSCGWLLLYVGGERYICTNPRCSVAEINGGVISYKKVKFESLLALGYVATKEAET